MDNLSNEKTTEQCIGEFNFSGELQEDIKIIIERIKRIDKYRPTRKSLLLIGDPQKTALLAQLIAQSSNADFINKCPLKFDKEYQRVSSIDEIEDGPVENRSEPIIYFFNNVDSLDYLLDQSHELSKISRHARFGRVRSFIKLMENDYPNVYTIVSSDDLTRPINSNCNFIHQFYDIIDLNEDKNYSSSKSSYDSIKLIPSSNQFGSLMNTISSTIKDDLGLGASRKKNSSFSFTNDLQAALRLYVYGESAFAVYRAVLSLFPGRIHPQFEKVPSFYGSVIVGPILEELVFTYWAGTIFSNSVSEWLRRLFIPIWFGYMHRHQDLKSHLCYGGSAAIGSFLNISYNNSHGSSAVPLLTHMLNNLLAWGYLGYFGSELGQ